MTQSKEIYTWRWERGLLSWGMEIPNANAEQPADMLHRCLVDAAHLINGFGLITEALWHTTSHGEFTLVQRFRTQLDKPNQQMALTQIERTTLKDAYAVDIDIAPIVSHPNEPTERLLENSANVYVEYSEFHGRPEGAITEGVYLNVSSHVDIYARKTATVTKDNRILADLNAPRLNRFLRQIQTHFGYRFTYIEYEGDRTQIDHNGFIGHDEPTSPAT